MRVTPVEAIDKHRGLVFRCMRSIKIPPYTEFKDIEQAGYEGLLQAVKRYDPSKDIKFSTFATWYIRGYVIRALYMANSLLHIPIKNFENKAVKFPTILSTDADDYGTNLIPDSKQSIKEIEDKLDYYSLKKMFDLFLNLLPPQQKRAIELYYFTLNDNGQHSSYREVADIMGISRERVRQLLDLGKKQLRNRFGKYLDVYI